MPIIHLKPDESGHIVIPKSRSLNRPYQYVWPNGRIEYEPLPLFDCLYELGEEGVEKYFPPSESYGWNEPTMNSMARGQAWSELVETVAPCPSRYGHLPLWFPDDDLKGRKLTPTAQVDRFLFLLENIIDIPEDHTQIEPKILIMGLVELRKAYDEDELHDWDNDKDWLTA